MADSAIPGMQIAGIENLPQNDCPRILHRKISANLSG